MVDRVELEPFDQADNVRDLDGYDAAWRQHDLDAGDEIVQLGHLCKHIVRDHEIRPLAPVDELPCQPRVEEIDDCLHTSSLRRLDHVGGRVDPECRDPSFDEVLQEVPVVRRQLDDEARLGQAEALRDHVRIASSVRDPRVRIRREVRVVPEDLVGGHIGLELGE